MRILLTFFALLSVSPSWAQHDALIDRALLAQQQRADEFALRQAQSAREQGARADTERGAL